jgi:DNA-binding response OmpR family regulator
MWGCQVRTAYTGPAAMQAASEDEPDIVILDIGMPGMDGFEVARGIRSAGGKGVLIAVTGYGTEADRRLAREAGFDYYVVKPVDPDELRMLLEGKQ